MSDRLTNAVALEAALKRAEEAEGKLADADAERDALVTELVRERDALRTRVQWQRAERRRAEKRAEGAEQALERAGGLQERLRELEGALRKEQTHGRNRKLRAERAEADNLRLVEALEAIIAVQDTEATDDDYTRALAITQVALAPYKEQG